MRTGLHRRVATPAEVGDIEIMYVPRIGLVRKPGLLFAESGSLVDELLEIWLTKGVLNQAPQQRRSYNMGGSRQTRHTRCVGRKRRPVRDHAIAGSSRWSCALGSAEMNTQLAASALRRRLQLHAYGLIERTATGEQIISQSEREVFELVGVRYREPAER